MSSRVFKDIAIDPFRS